MARGKITSIRPEKVTIMLDKERTIKYDLNSFVELEKRYGSVEAAMKELQKGNMKSVRVILWAGLIHDEAIFDEDGEPIGYKITPYQVGGWVPPYLMQEVSQKVEEAITYAIPEQQRQELIEKAAEVMQLAPDGTQMATVVPSDEEDAKNS